MPKMMILRGNHGQREDENGKMYDYKDGALHEPAAKEYARRRGYDGFVLDVSGDPPKRGKRDQSPQTLKALDAFHADKEITALYGFSGGGYNVWWILQALKADELRRLDLVVVLGAPETKESAYDKSNYPGAHWELVYKVDPLKTAKGVPQGIKDPHMFGPEALLAQTPDPNRETP